MKEKQTLPKNLENINGDPLAFIFGFCVGRFVSLYSMKVVKEYFGFIVDHYSKIDSDGIKNIEKGYGKFVDEINKQL